MRAIVVVLFLAAVGGWIANLIKLIADLGDSPVTTFFIARIAGVIIPVLGAILGYF